MAVASNLWLVFHSNYYSHKLPAVFFGAKSSQEAAEKATVSWKKLTVSTYITWVFAKSIFNASTLGGKFGIIGGIAYACWYLAFPVVGITIYRIRMKTSYKHLTELILDKFGVASVILFSLIITYRLFMEIWSNAAVVADLFGKSETPVWWAAVYAASCTPAVIILGGFRTSIFSDVIQGIVVLAFLIGLWIYLLANSSDASGLWRVNGWKLDDGWDIVVVGIIQGGISYGFMDPVLSDRAFLSTPKGMLRAFFVGGFLAGGVIFLFSFLGIYGQQEYGNGGNPINTATAIGKTVFNIVALIFVTSSVSTLDSTFRPLLSSSRSRLTDTSARKSLTRRPSKIAQPQSAFYATVGLLLFCSPRSDLSYY